LSVNQPHIESFRRACVSVGAYLTRCSRLRFLVVSIVAAVLVSLFFFSPKFHLWALSDTNSFETARGIQVLKQLDDPWTLHSRNALRWRLLFPVLGNVLGLSRKLFLALPFLGSLLLLFQICSIVEDRTGRRDYTFLATIVAATLSSHFIPTQWLGLFDAWYLLGLVGVAFASRRSPAFLYCLFCPWVDERFLIALPLALLTRELMESIRPRLSTFHLACLAGVLPYVTLRLGALFLYGEGMAYLVRSLEDFQWIPWSPLGWWMGFRAAWLLIGVFFYGLAKIHTLRLAWTTILLTILTTGVVTLLARDISRSVAVLLPLFVSGTLLLPRLLADRAIVFMGLVAASNLLIPALHVVGFNLDLISPLLLQLLRIRLEQ
jgi:hypothetical protein